MSIAIGFVSQKGGVGKSTLSKLVAREYTVNGWTVKIADMDTSQATSFHWNNRRIKNGVEPIFEVEQYRRVEDALAVSDKYDLLLFDGAPHATKETLQIAQASHLVVLPTGLSLDDLEPTVKLAHELKNAGINKEQIAFALCRVGTSEAEIQDAKRYIEEAGYYVLAGEIQEKIGYRRASDVGKTLTETAYPTLNKQADTLAQAIIDKVAILTS
jgi:chromosome partitioning protein